MRNEIAPPTTRAATPVAAIAILDRARSRGAAKKGGERDERADGKRHEREERRLKWRAERSRVEAEFLAGVGLQRDLRVRHQRVGNLLGGLSVEAPALVQVHELGVFALGTLFDLRGSTWSSRSNASRWTRIEMYSPAAIEKDPPNNPARPASRTTPAPGWAPAVPRTRDTFETRPSLTPNTAARSPPPRTSRCVCSTKRGPDGTGLVLKRSMSFTASNCPCRPRGHGCEVTARNAFVHRGTAHHRVAPGRHGTGAPESCPAVTVCSPPSRRSCHRPGQPSCASATRPRGAR